MSIFAAGDPTAELRRLQLMTAHAPMMQYVIDLETYQIPMINHDSFLGYSRAEIQQPGSIMAMLHPDDKDHAIASWQQAIAGQRSVVEYRLRSRAGTWEWVRTHTVPLPNPSGAITELGCYLEVITPYRQTLTELAESKSRLDLLVESSGQIIYDYQVASGVITWGGALTAVLGFTPEELDGGIAQWGDLIHEEDAPTIFRAIEDAERACTSFGVEYRLRRKNGSYAWIYDRGFFLPDVTGKAERMLGLMQDTTLRYEAEAERVAAQELVIAAQQATLRELSTPLIPVRDDILVMPLVGTLDSTRAQQIMEALLSGVERRRARATIIDITGVSIVDTQVANALLQAAQAVHLLGARVVLTGIRPEVAQTLVGLGVDLSAIITRATLHDGITTVMRHSDP